MQKEKTLNDIIFQGHAPIPYLKSASKLLVAGFLGVLTGWVLQGFFTLIMGVPYWIAYWPAIGIGFIVNLRSQVKMKNLKIEDKRQGSFGA
jgi:hypothetical protein